MPHTAVISALGAAMLFGASTPFAKRLVGDVSPLMLAGVLYLGSGLGLTIARLLRDSGWRAPGIPRAERKWLVAAILFGGVLGPALLMFGLERTSASSASLLLNLESVLTAVLAWGWSSMRTPTGGLSWECWRSRRAVSSFRGTAR